tara:strand:- start:3331 stop:7494 length:4164 start_codon:yes stop_codon:yes gene_type:complete
MLAPGRNLIKFHLKKDFKEELSKREVKWGYGGLSEFTYYRTYARTKDNGELENWSDCVVRVIEGMFSILKTHAVVTGLPWEERKGHKLAKEAAERLFAFKWTPPGRGLWMMGCDFVWERGGASLNNPLDINTEILTKEYGWIALKDIPDEEVTILSSTRTKTGQFSGSSGWFKATKSLIESHTAYELTFESKMGNSYTVITSENHRWFRKETTKKAFERVDTTELKTGQWLPRRTPPLMLDLSLIGAAHGFFFGDGTRSNGELHQFTDDNKKILTKLFSSEYFRDSNRVLDSGLTDLVVKNLPLAWGKLPDNEYKKDKRYIYGFLAGYFAADGRISDYSIHSARKEELEEVSKLFWELGIETTPIKLESTSSNFSGDRRLYKLALNRYDLPEQFFIKDEHKEIAKRRKFPKYMHHKITSIKKLNEQKEVMCLSTPAHENFVIKGFCVTSNCGFVTTENIDVEMSKPFAFLMDMSMLGVGVGFDTRGAGKATVYEPVGETEVIVVEDSREGWVEILSCVIDSYLDDSDDSRPIEPDTSQVREYGTLIKGFGGVASGPEPLIQGINAIKAILSKRIGQTLSSVDITDIFNIIGKIVVAGNVRRTAEIAFGDPEDESFAEMKDWNKFGEEMGVLAPSELKAISEEKYDLYNNDTSGDARQEIANEYKNEVWAYKFGGWRWASNNSILAEVGMDYSKIANNIAVNGEPGLFWLDNARKFGRMKDGENNKDYRVMGANPSLRKGTKVLTSEGIFPIEELENKTFDVVNLKGKISNAKCFLSGKNEQLVKINIEGGKSYYATKEHKWPIKTKYTNKKIKKVSSSDLKENYLIPIVRTDKLPEQENNGSYEDGFLIGWNLGDGWQTFRKDTNRVQYGFIVSDKDKSLGIDKYLSNILQGYGWTGNLLNKNEININNKNIDYLFSSFEVTHKSEGLPKAVWSKCSEEFRLGIIDALISSDGGVDVKHKRLEFYTSYKQLAYDVSELLGFYGIKSIIQKRVITQQIFTQPEKEYTRYTLRITGISNIQHFNKIFTITHKEKQEKIETICKTPIKFKNRDNYVKVTSIELTDTHEDVWDITVYDNDHCFKLAYSMTGNCNEQSLESYELCCLVETYPEKHDNYWEFQRTLKFAYLYAKVVTLMATHWKETNAVMSRNRRIGCSQSGIIQAMNKFGRRKYLDSFCDQAYDYIQYIDTKYSEWLGIPKSIKTTSTKPSGTVSLVAGSWSGIHYPEAEAYYRTIRVASVQPVLNVLRKANYRIEPSVTDPYKTSVVYFPVVNSRNTISKKDISIWEQVTNAVQIQKYWADNQVSITVTFNPDEADQISRCLEAFDANLKGISFLPISDHGYAQAPYQPAPREEIIDYQAQLLPLDFTNMREDEQDHEATKFCEGDSCSII